MVAMRKVPCYVPFVLLLLAFLSCVFFAHAAAAAGSYRRALLPREAAVVNDIVSGEKVAVLLTTSTPAVAGLGGDELPLPNVVVSGEQAMPTPAEMGGELPPADKLVGDVEEQMRRVDLQTEDYPGSGPNGRHDPRNPH